MELNLDFWQAIIALIVAMGGGFGGVRLLMGMAMRGADQATKTFVELSNIIASQAGQLQDANKETIAANKETINEMKKSLEFMSDMNELKNNYMEMQDNNVAMQTTIDKISATEAELQLIVQKQNEQITTLITDNSTLKSELKLAQASLDLANSKINDLTRLNGELKMQVDSMSNQVKTLTKERDDLKTQLEASNIRIATLEKRGTDELKAVEAKPE